MRGDRFPVVCAAHLLLLQDDSVLLLLRANTGYADGQYSVIAGHLDGGEQVAQAAIREAWEEAGVHIDDADIDVSGVMHRRADDGERIDFFLVCSRWTGDIQNCEPQKCDGLHWFDLDDLPANVVPYVRRGIENYRSGRWFDSFGWDRAGR